MRNSSLSLTVEVDPGTEIVNAFKDAIALPNKLKCTVEFKFNEVTCMANPGSDPESGASSYYEAIQSKRTYKIAVANYLKV